METDLIVIVSVFAALWLVLLVVATVLYTQVASLRRKVADMQATGRLRVQKLKMDNDKNHAFHNPAISPDEELSRRGYSMYVSSDDMESGRGTERQTGGQFIEELAHELDSRQQQLQQQLQLQQPQQQRHEAPPFLLQSIEENKRRSRNLSNPVANQTRQSDTNPNFIY